MFRRFNFLHILSSTSAPLHVLPSLVDAKTFTEMVRKSGSVLAKIIESDLIRANQNALCRAFRDEARNRSKSMCLGLTTLREEDVEEIIHEEFKLKDERLATCLVPYQCGVNIILPRLPDVLKEEYLKEIKKIEEGTSDSSFQCITRAMDRGKCMNKWVTWRDDDIYVSTGRKYLERVKGKEPFIPRIPVFAVLGHSQHGKTLLLDSLQKTNITAIEPHGMTQTCRIFTIDSLEKRNRFTFIDTPGDKMFVEARYFCHIICDFLLLVISVVDGLESQTYEAIKVALNVDRPIFVVFTKMDLLTEEVSAKRTLNSLLRKLSAEGLKVTLLPLKSSKTKQNTDPFDASLALLKEKCGLDRFFFPMRKLDRNYRGSMSKPVLELERQCIGLCVSAKNNYGINHLQKLLIACQEYNPCRCLHESVHWTAHNGVVQAVVVDSSKHLFNEEEFRANISRQRMQRSLDNRIEKEKNKSRCVINNMYRFLSTAQRKSTSQANRTSTSSLVVNVIVREGVVTPGMHFVADQSEGRVDAILNYSGEFLKKATPGMAVTLIDLHSRSGCPGSGSHVLSVCDEAIRFRIQRYRQLLQWYIEAFPSQLHLLRPKSMNTKFSHVGNFGQIGLRRDSLEAQLLYGKQPSMQLEENSKRGTLEVSQANECSNKMKQVGAEKQPVEEAMSVGEYIARKNQEGMQSSLLPLSKTSTQRTVVALTNSGPNTQKISPPLPQLSETSGFLFLRSVEALLEQTWRSYQPEKPCTTAEEYNMFLKSCIHVGVLLKVDSWHTARMLSRELLRWGTKFVMFQVVGIRFGPLDEEDILFFGQAAKIILCFRTPLSNSINLDGYLETQDTWVLQTDQIRDVELFGKWCSVTLHHQEKERRT